MPAHNRIETGNYAAALRSSDRTAALLAQLDAHPAQSEHAHRYAKHDISVGYSAAMMLGNSATTWHMPLPEPYSAARACAGSRPCDSDTVAKPMQSRHTSPRAIPRTDTCLSCFSRA